jgi:hypothetical protein
MKTKASQKARTSRATNVDHKTRELLAAARRMGRMVREENRRWGLPLIVMRDGKICSEPA